MKKIIAMLALVSCTAPVYSLDFSLDKTTAAGLEVKAADVPVPAVAAPAPVKDTVPQDLTNKFRQVSRDLDAIRNDLTWVRNDMDDLERRARQMIQTNSSDAFFQMDLRRMSSDMSRRFDNMRRVSLDVQSLLPVAQKDTGLNQAARDMDYAARDILMDTWPTLENSAQNLESTVRSGRPELVGYDAQWTAMDISRYTRQLSDQARTTSYDTQTLVGKTQP